MAGRDATTQPTTLQMLTIVILNLVPLGGVLFLGWSSYDIIFLYWMENLVIGAVAIGGMVIRRYEAPVDYFMLPMAAFFALHYGMFCWVHGGFVVSLFSDLPYNTTLTEAMQLQLAAPGMALAIASLMVLQVWERIRTPAHRDKSDTANLLMATMSPYRRIMILHFTLIASGFLLMALEEPLAGLIMLVGLKTLMDLWEGGVVRRTRRPRDPATLARFAQEMPEPVLRTNNGEKRFDTFTDLIASPEMQGLRMISKFTGGLGHLGAMIEYCQSRADAEADTGTAPARHGVAPSR